MCKKDNVCILPFIVSLILGILVGVLFFTGTIATTVILTPVIFATVFAIISLILLFVVAAFSLKREVKECVCNYGKCLTIGGVASLITGFFSLTLIESLAASSVIFAILIGIEAFALVLTFLSFVGLLVCLIKSNCSKEFGCCKFDNDYK